MSVRWDEFVKKITDKHFRQTLVSLLRYAFILAVIFFAYIFLANYVLQRSEQAIGFTGVYNYSFEMKQNYVHVRFNTLEPTASLVRFTDGNENVVAATPDYRRFHEHVASLKPGNEYTMTIDLKSQDKQKYTYKTEKISSKGVSITHIVVS